jgi:hypothetical protein
LRAAHAAFINKQVSWPDGNTITNMPAALPM